MKRKKGHFMYSPSRIKLTLPNLTIVLATILTGCGGNMPDTLGITNGKLSACPDKPNCVVSHNYDEQHLIDALSYNSELPAAYKKLLGSIAQMPGSKVITKNERYIHAEFTSRIMRYIDDVEFHFSEENKRIELRSASRVGHSDMGVNRERIETLRGIFEQ